MINREKFITFLKYIGITNEKLQAKIYRYYQKCYNKQYRRSRFEDYLKFIGCETAISEITKYIIYPQYRKNINIEIDKYQGIWGKELKHEIIL